MNENNFLRLEQNENADNKRSELIVDFNKANNAKVLDNESIIRQAIQKNPVEGFELLFKRYYQPLCSHAIRYVYSKQIAEDLVSEIFATMWSKGLYKNINQSSFRTYLYQALRNSIYNYLDKEFRHHEHHKKIIGTTDLTIDINTPQTILLFDELVLKIQAAISSLPTQCQKVFILSRVDSKKNNEIAKELDIKIKTVEAHLTKALLALRLVIQSHFK